MPINVRVEDDLRDRIDALRLDGVNFADAPKRQPWIDAALRLFVSEPNPGGRVADYLASHDDTGAEKP